MMEEASTGLQRHPSSSSQHQQQRDPAAAAPAAGALTQQQKAEMLADEDPLLISQSLTYVTDDGSVLHSFQSAPYATSTFLSFFFSAREGGARERKRKRLPL
jgi:hypothetical protein